MFDSYGVDMKRSFDLDKAMEVSNVSEYENNEILLKACGKTIKVVFRKKDLKSDIPHFTVRSENYHDRLAVDPFTYEGDLVAVEPAEVRSVKIGMKSDAQVEAEYHKSAEPICKPCGGSGVYWNGGAAWSCGHCCKFKNDSDARAFVKKVFETVIRNGGGVDE